VGQIELLTTDTDSIYITVRRNRPTYNNVFKSVGGSASPQSFVIFIPSGHGGQFTVSKSPPALNTNVTGNANGQPSKLTTLNEF